MEGIRMRYKVHSFILDSFYAHRLCSDKKLVFSDNEVIESISMTESTKKLW